MQTFFRHATGPSLFLLLLCQCVRGQNLVPNPSFEDVNTCAEFSQPCSPSAWFFLSRKLTTGYFPRFASATGSRHLQIVAVSRETVNRQYWETMLLCPLQAGERYAISLKIAAPGNKTELSKVCPNLRDIGLWFTTRFIFVKGDSLLQPRNYFSLSGATVRDLKNGWFEVKKEFTPIANASVLIIGNFARAANVDIIEQRSWPGSTIEILVDDIAVMRTKGQTCPNYQQIKDSLYAITWRHSDSRPGELNPDLPDSLPPISSLQKPTRHEVTDTPVLSHPHQVTDSSISSHPQPVADSAALPHLPRVADTIIVHNIQFDFDQFLIQNPDTLQRYRTLLTRPGIKKIQVVGFTDDSGPVAYNLDLSKKRAHEIARLLSAKFKIPPGLIATEGRGISRTYKTKDLNRRVEIYILHL